MKQLLLILPVAMLLGCDSAVEYIGDDDSADVSYLLMPGMEGRDLPFSSAVRVNNTLYLSGNLGNIPGTLDLADIAEWGAMNEVYKTFFKNPPARSALGASGLALGARVEIECIAVVN